MPLKPVRFTQGLEVRQFNPLPDAADNLGLSKSEVARAALDRYLDGPEKSFAKIKTPAA